MAKSTPNASILARHKIQIFSFLLILLTYIPSFLWMWDRWFARDSYYSHGVLIPFISAYLIWNIRGYLKTLPIEPSRAGIYFILIGAFIQIISSVFQVYFSSGFSFIIVLIGFILHFYGFKILKAVLFPVLFLIFMVPLPMVLVANISFKLKMMAANIASDLLNGMRIKSVQEGSMIILPHAQVIVDDLCSGLRSLISLMALGSLFAYWIKGRLIKRVIIFLCSIPIAVITNVGRIMTLALISEFWGSQYAMGIVHEVSGYVVFVMAFILLDMCVKIIE